MRAQPVGQHDQAGEGVLDMRVVGYERPARLEGCREPRRQLPADVGHGGEWVVAVLAHSPEVGAGVFLGVPRCAVVGDGSDQQREEGTALDPGTQRLDRQRFAQALSEIDGVRVA